MKSNVSTCITEARRETPGPRHLSHRFFKNTQLLIERGGRRDRESGGVDSVIKFKDT